MLVFYSTLTSGTSPKNVCRHFCWLNHKRQNLFRHCRLRVVEAIIGSWLHIQIWNLWLDIVNSVHLIGANRWIFLFVIWFLFRKQNITFQSCGCTKASQLIFTSLRTAAHIVVRIHWNLKIFFLRIFYFRLGLRACILHAIQGWSSKFISIFTIIFSTNFHSFYFIHKFSLFMLTQFVSFELCPNSSYTFQ